MRTVRGQMAIAACWFLPDALIRWMPRSFHETVEREVYDGLTRAEWFAAQVAELRAAPRTIEATPGDRSTSGSTTKEEP